MIPTTEISENIPTVITNLQSYSQEISPSTTLEENISTVEIESSSNISKPSDDGMNDDSNKGIESKPSVLFDSSGENVLMTMTTLHETMQNIVLTDVSSTETLTEERQAVHQEKTDEQSIKDSVSADTVHDETTPDRPKSDDSFVNDSKASTSLDTIKNATEKTNEQREGQETISTKPSPSDILVKLCFKNQQLTKLT